MLRRSPTAMASLAALALTIVLATANGAASLREHLAVLARVDAHDRALYQQLKAQLADLERRGNPQSDATGGGIAWYLMQGEGEPLPAPNLDPRRPESASSEWLGARHAILWPRPLALVSIGQRDLFPSYSRVTIRTKPLLVQSDELENPLHLLSGRLDLAFVLTFGLPLLMLPLTYDLIAGERERGTWGLVRAQPVMLRTVLAAKVLVIGTVLTTVATGATACAVLWWPVGSPGDDAAGLALLAAAIAAHVVFWLGAAAVVNLIARTPAHAAAALVAAWLAAAVIVPAAITVIVVTWVPAPSRVQLIAGIREAGNLTPAESTALLERYLDEHPDASLGTGPHDAGALRSLVLQDEVDRRTAPLREAHDRALAARQRLADRLQVLSPVVLVQTALNEVAGASNARFLRYGEQLDAFHAEWRAYFYPRVHQHAQLTAHDFDEFPAFVYHEDPSAAVLGRAVFATGLVLVAGIALLAIGWVRVHAAF